MMNPVDVELGIESSVKCHQTSETEYVDVSLKTVELATQRLADISKSASFEPLTS